MKRNAAVLLTVSILFSMLAGAAADAVPSLRTWTTRDGQAFEAELAAADGLRATLLPTGKPAVITPLASLTPDDAAWVRQWRGNWRNPLIAPDSLPPWPAQAPAPVINLKASQEEGRFTWESPCFRITSDLRLPDNAIKDIARVFEATRAALIAMPLGLHAGGETSPYAVSLFRDSGAYEKAGGPVGSGGYFDGRSRLMLVLLPNLGITETDGTVRLDYTKNLFVLKHEATHQLIARWHDRIPMWASEGIAEFVAALPYAQGIYTFQNLAPAMRRYLTKWRAARELQGLRLIPPATLMAMTAADWDDAVIKGGAYDLYDSSALLTYHFIQQQGGAPLAGFLDALRSGADEAAAEQTHLLRGKTRGQLAADLQTLAKKIGVPLIP